MTRYHALLLGIFAMVWGWAAIEPRYPHDWLLENYLVHFSFGLLLVYPLREIFMRVAKARGVWAYWFPLMLVLAFSATYEIIEWLVAARGDPAAGLAFLGAQGDVWDAQKDMVLAVIGAAITLLIVALIRWRYDPAFGSDLRASLKISRNDKPLGEVALREMLKRQRKDGG